MESNAKQGISDQAKAESYTMCVDKAKAESYTMCVDKA